MLPFAIPGSYDGRQTAAVDDEESGSATEAYKRHRTAKTPKEPLPCKFSREQAWDLYAGRCLFCRG